jgi:hypothetical protein
MEITSCFNFTLNIKMFSPSIMSSASASLQLVPQRQYVSTGVFTNQFFTYTKTGTTALGVPIFALAIARAGDLNNPKGRILRENGRKLIKGVNPSLNHPVNTAVEYTYLVGVIDTTVFPNVAGFIDPNSPVFAPFNTDKPYFLDSPVEAVDASTGLQDIGAPVYTRGDVTAEGQITMGSGFFNEFRSVIPITSLSALTLTTNPADAGGNETNAYIVGSIITHAPSAPQNLTLPSTAALLAVLGTTVGSSFRFTYVNRSANIVTLTVPVGSTGTTTIESAATIAATSSATFLVRVATATTINVFRV